MAVNNKQTNELKIQEIEGQIGYGQCKLILTILLIQISFMYIRITLVILIESVVINNGCNFSKVIYISGYLPYILMFIYNCV